MKTMMLVTVLMSTVAVGAFSRLPAMPKTVMVDRWHASAARREWKSRAMAHSPMVLFMMRPKAKRLPSLNRTV